MEKLLKFLFTIFLILIIFICFSALYSITVIEKKAPVYYIQSLPGNMLATTIPPYGIFIKEKYINEGDKPGTILAHERVHWLQYQERGFFKFYSEYLGGLYKYGRIYNDLEKDARKRSSLIF